MAIAYKTTTANAWLDYLYDTLFPDGSLLQIRTGSPAGPDNAAGGSLLAEITTPASSWAAASGKSKAKAGVWSVAASGTGSAGHYRFKNAGDTAREEGTITATGGGGDMTLDNISVASTQTVLVSTFATTSP